MNHADTGERSRERRETFSCEDGRSEARVLEGSGHSAEERVTATCQREHHRNDSTAGGFNRTKQSG